MIPTQGIHYDFLYYTGGGGGEVSGHMLVFYVRGLLLCRWHTVPTCSRIPSSKFENSNILDHTHSISNIKTPILLALNMLDA